MRAGKLAEARAHLAPLVDPRAVCLRAQVGAALGDGAAVTDAEWCIGLWPSRRGDPAVARAVVQALGTEARKRAYELLVGDLALAARAPLLEAAHHSSKLVRAGAHRAAKKLGTLDAFDEVGKLILDL